MSQPIYQRLTREHAPRQFAVALVTRYSLWLGEDHLLHVECSGATETYKRFYFRDIQAITIHKTNRRLVWNCVLAGIGSLVAFIFLLIWWGTNGGATSAMVGLGAILVVFAIPLGLNHLFGSTCACQLRTAVQTEDLPSLTRVRKARKVLDRIRPLIAATQGQITGEEVARRLQETLRAETPTAAPAADASESAVAGAVPPVIS